MAVKIASSPFNILEGVFQREAVEYVVALLNLLGQDASVRVFADSPAPSLVF